MGWRLQLNKMRTKNLMLFAYDFPHKKTQDILLRLIIEGYTIKYVIAAPRVKLKNTAHSLHKPTSDLIESSLICKKFKIPYIVLDHNDPKTSLYLKKNPVDLYIISGARILSAETIEATHNMIINIHPGLLPESRGLDTIYWSIYNDVPIGITAHFISSKIDSGKLIYKEKLTFDSSYSISNISLLLLEKQTDVLIKALDIIKNTKKMDVLLNLNSLTASYFSTMPEDLVNTTIKKFPSWRKKYAIKSK